MAITFSNFNAVSLFGDSSDLKPTANIPIGSKFYEQNTQQQFVFNGSTWGIHSIGRTNSLPYGYDIAEGNIPDHVAFVWLGVYSALGTTDIDIWEGGSVYPWMTSAQTVSIVSTQANDSAAGSGVRTIYINYLDSAGITGRETITMNGTAAVTSSNTMYRINTIVAASTGGVFKATGTITVSVNSTAIATIVAGNTKSRMAVYQVPTGKTLYITSVSLGAHSATKGVRFILRTTYDDDNNVLRNFFLPHFELVMTNGGMDRHLQIPERFPAGTRLKMSAIADLAGAYVSCSIRGWLEVD